RVHAVRFFLAGRLVDERDRERLRGTVQRKLLDVRINAGHADTLANAERLRQYSTHSGRIPTAGTGKLSNPPPGKEQTRLLGRVCVLLVARCPVHHGFGNVSSFLTEWTPGVSRTRPATVRASSWFLTVPRRMTLAPSVMTCTPAGLAMALERV